MSAEQVPHDTDLVSTDNPLLEGKVDFTPKLSTGTVSGTASTELVTNIKKCFKNVFRQY